VYNALISQGFRIKITRDPQDLKQAGRVILPGVGAFRSFMDGLNRFNLIEGLAAAVRRGDPLLGICVGMQALFNFSTEMGQHPGLGLLPGSVIRFPEFEDLKVPHTGWNQLHHNHTQTLLSGIPSGSYAYFNHSYYCAPQDSQQHLTLTDYGISFCSAAQHENIYGVQFHPEKSQRVGLRLLANFINM
jgi:glutamine amidotransferase